MERGAPPERGTLALSILLAGLAGWVDAVGFVHWHGLFVSFMSGNTTQLAAALGTDWALVREAGRALLVFVAGVTLGELLGPACGRWSRAAVLAFEAALLWSAFGASQAGLGPPVTTAILGLAMGVQNASIHQADGIGVSLTFVTGTLVKIGRGLAEALRGTAARRAVMPYLGLWFGLFAGALGGAATARPSEPDALAVVATLASALAILSGAAVWRAGAVPGEA